MLLKGESVRHSRVIVAGIQKNAFDQEKKILDAR
jgi:hypothetical protein